MRLESSITGDGEGIELDENGEPVRWVLRSAEVAGLGTRFGLFPFEVRAWTPDVLEDLTRRAAQWVKGRAPGSRDKFFAEIGLPFLLAQAGEVGREIAERVQAAERVPVPVRRPSRRNTSWHLTVLPWLASRRIDPWGPQVCEVMDEWGRGLAGHGDVPDHVWPGDVQRAVRLSAATIRTRAAVTRSYYRWHYAMGLTSCSPADIWTPRAAGVPAQPQFRDTDDVVDRGDLARLQLAADEHEGIDGDRELCSAVVAALVSTAARAEEVCRADVADYLPSYHEGAKLLLHGKGGRDRYAPLDAEAVARIDRWLLWRPDLDTFGTTARDRLIGAMRAGHRIPLFTPIRGSSSPAAAARRTQEGHVGRMRTGTVRDVLKRVCGRSFDDYLYRSADRFHPHAIRAAVATALLDDGASISEVAGLLGHSSVTTTARYDRRQRDRHLPAWTTGAQKQAAALEAARRALTRDRNVP